MDDLRKAFIKSAPKTQLEQFFEQWFDRAGAPPLEQAWKQDGDAVRLTITQTQEGEPYDLRFDVALRAENEKVARVPVNLREKQQSFTFSFRNRLRAV